MKQFFRQFFVLLISSLCILQACQPPNIIGTFDTNKNKNSFNIKADPLCGEKWSVSVPYSDDDTTVTVNGNQVLSVPVRGSDEIVDINLFLNQGINTIVFTTTNTGCPGCGQYEPDQYPYGWTYNIYKNGVIYLSDSNSGRDGNNTSYSKSFSINANIQPCPTPTPQPTSSCNNDINCIPCPPLQVCTGPGPSPSTNPNPTPTAIDITPNPSTNPSSNPSEPPAPTPYPSPSNSSSPNPTPSKTPKPLKNCNNSPIINANKNIFTPNEDGKKDTLAINIRACGNWNLKIEPTNLSQLNIPGFDKNNLIKQFSGTDEKQIIWDGKNNLGEVLHTNYKLTVTAEDGKTASDYVEIAKPKEFESEAYTGLISYNTEHPFRITSASDNNAIGACGGKISLVWTNWVYPKWMLISPSLAVAYYGIVTSADFTGIVSDAVTGKEVYTWSQSGKGQLLGCIPDGGCQADMGAEEINSTKAGFDLSSAYITIKTWSGRANKGEYKGKIVPAGKYNYRVIGKVTYAGFSSSTSESFTKGVNSINITKNEKGIPNKNELVPDSKFMANNRHLTTSDAYKRDLRKDGNAHVFNDESTMNMVINAILDHGERIDCERHDFIRYGLYFDEPIGYRIEVNKNGDEIKRTLLYFGELKIRDNIYYHPTPRTRPASK